MLRSSFVICLCDEDKERLSYLSSEIKRLEAYYSDLNTLMLKMSGRYKEGNNKHQTKKYLSESDRGEKGRRIQKTFPNKKILHKPLILNTDRCKQIDFRTWLGGFMRINPSSLST